ncbi:MAG TPA: cell wall hydrolase [Magnetospirillum sp.]|jgi:spore germination cell wall hydrolase CwlJ-like protein|nr:cell wall hydrolase [Magnetospirillum sp.]
MSDPILIIDAEPDAESQQAPVKPGSPADILARTLWGEARGEPVRGIEAVAAVVMNRVRHGGWWGDTVETVCKKPMQFSCWNPDDPNRAKLERVDDSDRVFRICVRTAWRAIAGALDDPTNGATHYHVRGLYPLWARGRTPTTEIGNHVFYAGVE